MKSCLRKDVLLRGATMGVAALLLGVGMVHAATTIGVGLLTNGGATITGTTLINASGSTNTTIGTGGTGEVAIGNAVGNTSLTGSLAVSGDVTKGGISMFVPTGSMSMFAGISAPAGYVLCDGSSYSTTTYASLFSVIGYTYGGSGATFNVPDMRGRAPKGVSSGVGGIADRALGVTGGEENHTMSIDEMPAHSHSFLSANSDTSNHGINIAGSYDVNTGGTHSDTTDSAGGGDAFNVLDPYLAVNYIIKY